MKLIIKALNNNILWIFMTIINEQDSFHKYI